MRRYIRFIIVLGLVALLSDPGQATVTFYTSQVAFDAAATTGLIEDFENTGATIDQPISGFSHNGVTYQGLTGGVPFANVYLYSPGGSEFGAGVPQPLTTTILTGNGEEHFSVTFDAARHAVGFDAYLNGLGPATVDVYGGVMLLGSFAFPDGQNDKAFLGFTSSVAITSFVWTATFGAVLNTGIDNLVADMPEPGTLGLFGMAMAGLLMGRRRRS